MKLQQENGAQRGGDCGAGARAERAMSTARRSWPQKSNRDELGGPQATSIDSRRLESQAISADCASCTALMRSALGAGTSPRSIRAILSSADTLSSRNSIRSSKFRVFCASFILTSVLSPKVASAAQGRLCDIRLTSTPKWERARSPLPPPAFLCLVFNEHKGFLNCAKPPIR
jgi:hypothetical protein